MFTLLRNFALIMILVYAMLYHIGTLVGWIFVEGEWVFVTNFGNLFIEQWEMSFPSLLFFTATVQFFVFWLVLRWIVRVIRDVPPFTLSGKTWTQLMEITDYFGGELTLYADIIANRCEHESVMKDVAEGFWAGVGAAAEFLIEDFIGGIFDTNVSLFGGGGSSSGDEKRRKLDAIYYYNDLTMSELFDWLDAQIPIRRVHMTQEALDQRVNVVTILFERQKMMKHLDVSGILKFFTFVYALTGFLIIISAFIWGPGFLSTYIFG